MWELHYRTRGGSSPQGKPRVYFCCHPADFALYFETISDEILEKQDCAIWYDTSPEADCNPESLSSDLTQMQLFVVPVTTRFLCQPSRARDVEFRLALDACIPVLPLMQESGLEQLFNKVCGPIQILDRTSRDATAIRYEEKLERFLSSVLVGDELARKVRAAFDAYVFLSYRKKDRAYAQKLMRLIHQNDFCRDIAIWYDEFLVPGEDFNSAIQKALRESGLFAMVVTPNLTEEDNYVMREEYPRARNSRKPIFPVEMIPTDRQALKEKYTGLPQCVSTEDEKEFPLALLEAVQKMRFRENEDSPSHLFFIGLAYLNGIDVEVDHAKGLELISAAAEKGLPEAMEKLVGMYWNGEAVKIDCQRAIQWQERLVEHRWDEYSAERGFEDGIALVTSLGDYGNYLYEIRDLETAWDAYDCMREISEELVENAENAGKPGKAHGKTVQPERAARGAEKEAAWPEGAEARTHEGQAASADGCPATEPAQEARLKLAWSYQCLAAVSMTEDRQAEAEDFLLKMLEAVSQIKGDGTAKEESLFIAYNNLGYICLNLGRLEDAEGHFRNCLEVSRKLADEVGTPDTKRMYAVANHGCGSVRQLQLRWKEAESYYQAEYDITSILSEETRQPREVLDLWGCHVSLSVICVGRYRFREAERHLEKCLEISLRLNGERDTVESRKALAESYGRLAMISQGSAWPRYIGALILAWGMLFSGYFLYFRYFSGGPASAESEMLFSVFLLGALILLMFFGFVPNVLKGVRYFRKGLKVRRQLYEELKTVETKEGLIGEYGKLSTFLQVTPFAAKKAEEYYRQYLELCRQWHEETGSIQARYALAKCYGDWGSFCRQKHRRKEARQYLRQSVEMLEELCKETERRGYRSRLAEAYFDLATFDATILGPMVFRRGTIDRKVLEKAYKILESLGRQGGDSVRPYEIAQKKKKIRRLLK